MLAPTPFELALLAVIRAQAAAAASANTLIALLSAALTENKNDKH